MQEILADRGLTVHAKEETLLRLALEDKELDKAIRDLRRGVVNILEEEHPDMKYGALRKELGEIFEGLEKVQIERQAELAKAIEGFLASELPDYHVVVEKQSQLEQLLRELTPDQDKYAERLLDANNELMRQLSPHSERLFERYGMQQFGPDVRLKTSTNSQPTWIRRFLRSRRNTIKGLQEKIYPLIEEKRRELIQEYVSTKIPSKELAKVRNQQNYINRYINKRFLLLWLRPTRKRCSAGLRQPVNVPYSRPRNIRFSDMLRVTKLRYKRWRKPIW